ncbi:MAG: hypothetical protein ACLFR1_02650 [Spirochaetia bacterium]
METILAENEEKIRQAIQTQRPLSIKTYTFPRDSENYFVSILDMYLSHLDLDHLVDKLSYCLRELITNAIKANTKRAYFSIIGLDIDNTEHYAQGMTYFRERAYSNIDKFIIKQKQMGFYVKLRLQIRNNELNIAVINNAEINKQELDRINDRILHAKQYNTAHEVMENLIDFTEGAGLGIIMTVLMLKEIGMDADSFLLTARNGETSIELTIPLQ